MKNVMYIILGMFLCAGLGGIFLLIKTPMGWDVFKVGGYHSYLHCLEREVRLATQGRNEAEQKKYNAAHAHTK